MGVFIDCTPRQVDRSDWHVEPQVDGKNLVVKYYREGSRIGLAVLQESALEHWALKKAEDVAGQANEILLQVKPHLWWDVTESGRVEYHYTSDLMGRLP